jgi:hypothetical protein
MFEKINTRRTLTDMSDGEFPMLSKYVYQLAAKSIEVIPIVKNYINDSDSDFLRTLKDVPQELAFIHETQSSITLQEIKAMLVFYIKQRNANFKDSDEPIFTNAILTEGEYKSTLSKIKKQVDDETKKNGVQHALDSAYEASKKKKIKDFEREKIEVDSGRILIRFSGVTPVELFEKIVVGWNVPMAVLKWKGREVTKVFSGLEIDKRWFDVISKNMKGDEVSMCFIINNVPEGGRYSTKANDIITYGIVSKASVGTSYTLEYEFETRYGLTEQRINAIIDTTFPHPLITHQPKIVQSISGHSQFKKVPFDKTTFSDFVFIDDVASKVLFFNEDHNSATAKKRYHLYMFRFFGLIYEPAAGIMTTLVRNYTDIEVRMKNVSTIEEMERHLDTMNKIFVIYAARRDQIEKEYAAQLKMPIAKFLGIEVVGDGIGEEKVNKKEGQRLGIMKKIMSTNPGRTYKDLFNQDIGDENRNRGWSLDCAKAKHPYILTDETMEKFEAAKDEFVKNLKKEGKTPAQINAAVGVLSREWNGYTFACLPREGDAEQPHVAVRFNERTGEPCCAVLDVALKEKKPVHKYVKEALATNKKLDYGRMGLAKPHQLDRIIKIIRTTPLAYARLSVGFGNDTFLKCVTLATNSNMITLNSVEFDEKIIPYKVELGLSPDEYIDPDMWITSLSNKYNANIILFSSTPDNAFADLHLPASYPEFDPSKKCIIILIKIGETGEATCELFVKIGERFPTMIFDIDTPMWDIMRNLFESSSRKYVLW